MIVLFSLTKLLKHNYRLCFFC